MSGTASTPATPDPRGDDSEAEAGWGQWVGVGIEFGAAVLLFFWLGSRLDATWGTDPWMQVAGTSLGVVVGTYLLIQKALRSERIDKSPRNLKPK